MLSLCITGLVTVLGSQKAAGVIKILTWRGVEQSEEGVAHHSKCFSLQKEHCNIYVLFYYPTDCWHINISHLTFAS